MSTEKLSYITPRRLIAAGALLGASGIAGAGVGHQAETMLSDRAASRDTIVVACVKQHNDGELLTQKSIDCLNGQAGSKTASIGSADVSAGDGAYEIALGRAELIAGAKFEPSKAVVTGIGSTLLLAGSGYAAFSPLRRKEQPDTSEAEGLAVMSPAPQNQVSAV